VHAEHREGRLAKAVEASVSAFANPEGTCLTFGSFEAAWYFILSIATGTRGISTFGDALSSHVSCWPYRYMRTLTRSLTWGRWSSLRSWLFIHIDRLSLRSSILLRLHLALCRLCQTWQCGRFLRWTSLAWPSRLSGWLFWRSTGQ
jgi:hypothetical protein